MADRQAEPSYPRRIAKGNRFSQVAIVPKPDGQPEATPRAKGLMRDAGIYPPREASACRRARTKPATSTEIFRILPQSRRGLERRWLQPPRRLGLRTPGARAARHCPAPPAPIFRTD